MLYIVATPIGNLGEITYRAVEVLSAVDAVLCEDTRHTRILMDRYGVSKPLISYQRHNERARTDEIIERLKSGESLALVSDAGMPIVSDPGHILLDRVIEEGLEYTVVSGPCALINAVVLSGLDASSFCMVGFLPEKTADKREQLDKFRDLAATLIFYVPPHDASEIIAFLAAELGDRRAALVREISKIHEEVVRGTLASFPEFTQKGEFVLVVEGAKKKENSLNALPLVQHVEHYISGGLDKKSAMKTVAKDRGITKSEVYAAYERAKKDGNE